MMHAQCMAAFLMSQTMTGIEFYASPRLGLSRIFRQDAAGVHLL